MLGVSCQIQTVRIGDPSQATGGDACDAEGYAVAVAEFRFAVGEQAGQSAIDVAEAEEAEVVDGNGFLARGLTPL